MHRTRHRRLVLPRAHGLIAAAIGVVLAGLPVAIPQASTRAVPGPAAVGAVAQDFVLKAVDGRNHRLSEYRGDPVVVTFWGSWCGLCRDSLVALDALSKQTGTAVVGISLDGARERAASASAAARISFPTLLDDRQQVARAYAVDELPLTLLLDRSGVVRARWSGDAVDVAGISRSLDSLARE